MKLNRKLVLVVSLVLSLALTIGSTIAYLSDSDMDVNVMTLGNVDIEQHEFERIETEDGFTTDDVDGEESYMLQDFTQGKPLLPAVGDTTTPEDTTVVLSQLGHNSTGEMTVLPAANVQDKFVVVENTGKTDAYVRTLVAFEAGEIPYDEWNTLIGYTYNSSAWTATPVAEYIQIDGQNFYVVEFLYNGTDAHHEDGIVPPGDYTINSLAQVFMASDGTNEDVEALDGNGNDLYDIYVVSQAVQAAGFENAQIALDEAFGDVSKASHPWMDGQEGDQAPDMEVVTVNSADELQAALENAEDGDVILLGDSITGNVTVTMKADVGVTIDGLNKDFAGVITLDGKSGTIMSSDITIQNVNFKADAISADACIRLGDGTTPTRYVCNATVKNCTFDVPGAVGVKSYTGGDKNLTISGCTATENAHSLCQLKGVDGVLIENCTVNSKNGINLNNSDNVVIKNCDVDVKGYAVRCGESSGGAGYAETYRIEGCTLKSANDDGDATIILRGTADNSTLTIVDTTIEGTPDITNTASGATVIK